MDRDEAIVPPEAFARIGRNRLEYTYYPKPIQMTSEDILRGSWSCGTDSSSLASGVAPTMLGAVIWFTGLSGSGKTTIAERVVAELESSGRSVEPLDGDAIRAIFPETGFSREERNAHIGRVGYFASRLEHHGIVVVASFVSPYRQAREFVRGLCHIFVEAYLSTPLDVCERRDVKGLYSRARRGEIRQFTGIDDPYEPPTAPELTFDTSVISPDEAASQVVRVLRDRTGRV
jgi:adenylylsulfate kinase